MSILFPTFYLDDRRTGRVIVLRHRDYALACFFASIYVLWLTDFRTFAKAFLSNLVFIALAILAVLAASLLPDAYAVIALGAALAILAVEQGRTMVRYIVAYHTAEGWGVTPG